MRPIASRVMRLRWPVTVHRADLVPAEGGVILAANHIGLVDGPMLATFAPRPVHALTKAEMFGGFVGAFLRGTGQIPLDRWAADPAAIRSSLRVVRDGGVLGIFPEGTRGNGDLRRFHHGAAYLALVTGAPVVPVTLLGTRAGDGIHGAAAERRRHRHRLRPAVAHDTGAMAPHPGTRGRHLGVAPGAHAFRAGRRPLRRRADPCPSPSVRDNPRTTPTPGSSSPPQNCRSHE